MTKRITYIFYLFVYGLFLLSSPASASQPSRKELILIKKDTVPTDFLKDVVKITRTWELPPVLTEISGIDYLDSERIICIQHEIGSLFIYNIASDTLEAEIPFGPPGDYEAVAVVKDDAYIACADGRLLEIGAFASSKPVVKEYGTHLTVRQNVEGLTYDPKNKMLLVAIQGTEEGNTYYKGVYAFDIATKKMPVAPIIKIDLQDPVFGSNKAKKMQAEIQPSDVALNPTDGNLYFPDAIRDQVLIMDRNGKIKGLFELDKTRFRNPTGITFTPAGECYMADEGNKLQPSRLMLVSWKIDQ